MTEGKELSGRLIAPLYLAAGLAGVVYALGAMGEGWQLMATSGVLAFLVGATSLLLPWGKMPDWVFRVMPSIALVNTAVSQLLSPELVVVSYLWLLMVYVWVGACLPRRDQNLYLLAAIPVAALSPWIHGGPQLGLSMAFVAVVCCGAVSHVLNWYQRAIAKASAETLAAQEEAARQRLDLIDHFRILADEVPAAVFRCDRHGTVLFHNARLSQLIEDHEGDTRLHDLVADDDAEALSATLAALAAADHADRLSIDVNSRDGATVWRISLRPTGDFGSGDISMVGSIEDVTATVRLQTEVRYDALTGVLNRQGLDECLTRMVSEEPDSTLVVFIDLDGFKVVNDAHGHEAGDIVLAEVADRLSASLRPGDAVGRYGGDEFLVACRNVLPGDEGVIVRRIDDALSGAIAFAGGDWQPAASIGTARPRQGEALSMAVRRADQAMFAVKRERKRELGLRR